MYVCMYVCMYVHISNLVGPAQKAHLHQVLALGRGEALRRLNIRVNGIWYEH